MRVDHVCTKEDGPKVVKRADFDADRRFGFVCYEFNPEREEVIIDRASGKKLVRKLDPDIGFRCTECQFDTLDRDLMKDHIALANHQWSYNAFNNPYGHCARVVIEGIEDYAAFLKAEKESAS